MQLKLRLGVPAGDAIAIKSPSEALPQIHLAICLTSGEGFDLVGEYLLVLKDWDFWSEAFEEIGSSLLSGVRANSSEYRNPWEAPAHVCKSSELPDLRAMFCLLSWHFNGTHFCCRIQELFWSNSVMTVGCEVGRLQMRAKKL